MATTTDKPATLEVPSGAKSVGGTRETTRYRLILGLSENMNARIEDLAAKYSCSKADVINMAVGLLKFASDAVGDGKRVVVVDDANDHETEVVGL